MNYFYSHCVLNYFNSKGDLEMMYRKSKIFMALASAALCMNIAQAVAAVPQVPVVTTEQTISFVDGTSEFGQKFSKDYKGYNFLSNFVFSIGGSSDFDSALVSMAGNKTDLSFTGFDLYTSGGNLIRTGTNVSTGTLDVWSLSAENIVSGNYRLAVTGNVLGINGGSFGGNVNISPIPEPATWGMMIGGLAVVGMAVRRRNANAKPDFFNALAA
jgi:opacity protein-like surface antigen